MSPTLTQLRLNQFKSVRKAGIRIDPLTLIVGRNGSGKSNVLDALAVLSAIASGADLRDALDGGREGPVVRGGSEGCAPLGTTRFGLGCSAVDEGVEYHLDIEIQTSPTVQIASEHLWTKRTSGPRRGEPLDLLKSEPPSPYSGDIIARWENGNRGVNPPINMRANQLLTFQVQTRVPATSQAGRRVHHVAQLMLQAISSIFILDPIPHQMREYVAEKDSRLRRNADNLSAVLNRLAREPGVRQSLLGMTRSLSEAQISDIGFVSSDLGDVMVTISERIGDKDQQVPARLMSDGTLRFLAIAAAMLDTPDASGGTASGRVLVVEELENGLHPSQAALLLSRLRETASDRRVKTIATTHSPAILDALPGAEHRSVVVSSRDMSGWSTITRLVDFPDYFEVIGRDTLGASAVKDRLRPREVNSDEARSALSRVLSSRGD